MADENTVYIIVALSGTAKNDVIFEDQFWPHGPHRPALAGTYGDRIGVLTKSDGLAT